jgi:hypothetical protein
MHMQVRGSHPLTSTFIETGICDNGIYNCSSIAVFTSEKLEWGNSDHLSSIIEKHPGGFDLVLGADIYILEIFLPNCFYFKALAFLFFSFAM